MNKVVFFQTGNCLDARWAPTTLPQLHHAIKVGRKSLEFPRFWLLGLVLVWILPTSLSAQSRKKKTEEVFVWKYELEAAGVGMQGTYQVKVWSYTKTPDEVQEVAMKNAVHGIIFKGFIDKGRLKGQRPLAQDPNLEVEQAPYFAEFFKSDGRFLKFVALVDNGAIAPGDRIQVGKEYKIGITVSVQVSALRKELEEAGIIKSLSSGF